MLNHSLLPATLVSELPLKLARKCIDILGTASFEEEDQPFTFSPCNDEEVAAICAGKDFGLIRTSNGKVLYYGKAASLGIKQTGIRSNKWSELILTKSPKVKHVCIGHDGLHAVIVVEDGSVYFTGNFLILVLILIN